MLVLALGGVRSGKSAWAETRVASAAAGSAVTYLATARDEPSMAARIAAHRLQRPETWTTVEAADLSDVVTTLERPEAVLLDSLGTWLARQHDFVVDTRVLVSALLARHAPTVVVSDEVGLGVHPPTELGRRFADALGALNRAVADAADEVVLVVAGRALQL